MSFAISSVTWELFEIELVEPFDIAGGGHSVARIVVVSLTLDDGTLGLGEAAPLPVYNGETLDHVEVALEQARPRLEGTRFLGWREGAEAIEDATAESGSARCALESALVDAVARRESLHLGRFFGDAADHDLETDVTIPIGSAGTARRAARKWWSEGFRTLKIKVGVARTDVERVVAAHEGAPDAKWILDANAGLTGDEAVDLLFTLRRHGVAVALFEQPVARGDWNGLRQVAGAGARVALDESAVTTADVPHIARELGPGHVVNIKLMKAGIAEGLAIAEAAKRAGLGLMIGGMVESTLAMTVSACFASGLGGFEFVDLDTPLFLRDAPFTGGYHLDGPRIDLSRIAAGHGVSVTRR